MLAMSGCAAASIAFAAPAPASRHESYCFGPDDGAKAPFRVIRYPSRPPLTNRAVGYKYYPLTDSTGSQASIVNAGIATNIQKNYFMWANICNYIPGVNNCHQFRKTPGNADSYAFGNPPAMPQYDDPLTGKHLLFKMTSYERANACTMAQAAFALDHQDGRMRALAVAAGLTVVTDRSTLSGLLLDSDHMFRDVCVLPDARLSPTVRGLILDYEVHDGRSPQMSRDFLVAFAALVHGSGREAILYTNPLNASGQALSALNASNLNEIQSAFDMTTILLFRGGSNPSFEQQFNNQLDLLQGPKPVRPPAITFDLARSTLGDAEDTRNLMLKYRLPAVIVFQKTADLAGPCSTEPNRKLACLLTGACSN